MLIGYADIECGDPGSCNDLLHDQLKRCSMTAATCWIIASEDRDRAIKFDFFASEVPLKRRSLKGMGLSIGASWRRQC